MQEKDLFSRAEEAWAEAQRLHQVGASLTAKAKFQVATAIANTAVLTAWQALHRPGRIQK